MSNDVNIRLRYTCILKKNTFIDSHSKNTEEKIGCISKQDFFVGYEYEFIPNQSRICIQTKHFYSDLIRKTL